MEKKIIQQKTIKAKIQNFVAFFLALFIIVSASMFFVLQNNQNTCPQAGNPENQFEISKKPDGLEKNNEEETEAGPDAERKYFEKWHEPFGTVLAPSMLKGIWNDINKMPRMTETSSQLNQWTMVGPNGV